MDFNKIISGLTNSGIGSGLAGGVAGGALVSALGSKSGRKTATTLLKVGGIAAVGGLAWKAYQNYQQSSVQQTPQPAAPQPIPSSQTQQSGWTGLEQQQFEAVAHQESDSTGMLLLRSMISAAMADGQLSQGEQGQIFGKLEQLNLSTEERGTLFDEMAKPWTAVDFGRYVKDPVIAIEVYTTALMTIDETCEAGRAHLRALSNALRLPVPLVTSLHARVQEQVQAA